MGDLISRRKAFEYFVTLWECIGTIMDHDEWEDVCMTTANEIPSAEPEYKELQDWKTDFKGFIDDLLYIPRDDYRGIMEYIDEVPSAETEIKPISYTDCSNAMLKMWIDNVLTDGEYNKIMDKLNAKHRGE